MELSAAMEDGLRLSLVLPHGRPKGLEVTEEGTAAHGNSAALLVRARRQHAVRRGRGGVTWP